MSRLREKSKGQFIVVLTIAIVALLGVIALCTDIGVVYYNYVKLQKAADSAALAGANYLPEEVDGVTLTPAPPPVTPAPWCGNQSLAGDAEAAACNYVVLNGGDIATSATFSVPALASDLADLPVALPAGTNTIEVTLTRNDIPVFFARVLGRTTPYTVTVKAIAASGPAGAITNPLPIGLQQKNWKSGDTVSLYENDVAGAGNWEWLSIPPGCSGASCDVPNGSYVPGEISGGCGGCSLSVGDNVYTQPGEAWGPISSALTTLLGVGAGQTASPGVDVIVPIVNWTDTTNGSSTDVTITGFAEIQLTGFGKSGNNVYLNGTFVQNMPSNALGAGENGYPYPPYIVWLVK